MNLRTLCIVWKFCRRPGGWRDCVVDARAGLRFLRTHKSSPRPRKRSRRKQPAPKARTGPAGAHTLHAADQEAAVISGIPDARAWGICETVSPACCRRWTLRGWRFRAAGPMAPMAGACSRAARNRASGPSSRSSPVSASVRWLHPSPFSGRAMTMTSARASPPSERRIFSRIASRATACSIIGRSNAYRAARHAAASVRHRGRARARTPSAHRDHQLRCRTARGVEHGCHRRQGDASSAKLFRDILLASSAIPESSHRWASRSR